MLSNGHTNSNFLIIGYTTRDHLLLDLDDKTQIQAEQIVCMVQASYKEVGDCLIMKSSTSARYVSLAYDPEKQVAPTIHGNSYHLIFDNRIGYNKIVKICEMLADLDIIEQSFKRMRYFRGDLTLRISPTITTKGIKQMPTPVSRIKNVYTEKKGEGIDNYLRLWRLSLFLTNQRQQQRDSLYKTNADIRSNFDSIRETSTAKTLVKGN